MLFGGNATKLNVGARFKNRLFYTILGGGTHYLDFGDKFSAALFYRAGLELPLYKQLFISGDLGYQHIETFKTRTTASPPACMPCRPVSIWNTDLRTAWAFSLPVDMAAAVTTPKG